MASLVRVAAMRSAVRVVARRSVAMRHMNQRDCNIAAVAPWSSQRAFSTEKVTFTFIDAEGEAATVAATPGQSLLDVAHENDIELEGAMSTRTDAEHMWSSYLTLVCVVSLSAGMLGACGGELACSTCHLVFEKELFEQLPEISEEEEDMLDLAWGLTDTSRLGCQIKVTKDLEGTTVRVPDESNNLM